MSYRAVHVGAELTGKRELRTLNSLSLLRLQPAAHKHCSWLPHKLRSDKANTVLQITLSLLRLRPAATNCCWSPHKLRSVTELTKPALK